LLLSRGEHLKEAVWRETRGNKKKAKWIVLTINSDCNADTIRGIWCDCSYKKKCPCYVIRNIVPRPVLNTRARRFFLHQNASSILASIEWMIFMFIHVFFSKIFTPFRISCPFLNGHACLPGRQMLLWICAS
jgi:hypothetical protein